MTGLIARSFIDEVLSKTDIVEFIDTYLPLKKQGTSYTACCPFHNEKSPSFNVITKKQFYYCFGCGASGNVISFVMNFLHVSFSDAIEMLASRLGLEVIREGKDNKQKSKTQNLYQFLAEVTKFYQKTLANSEMAINYLKSREITGEIAKRYQLGYAPPAWQTLENYFKNKKAELLATGMLINNENNRTYDRFRHRIMFPIQDRHGRIIGFGGRVIDSNQKPKYLNSPETVLFQKNHEVYGLYQIVANQSSVPYILVVEGYMDVIALAQHGIDYVVATLGTSTSSFHIQLLAKYTKKILFCFDGDEAGKQAAWRALESTLPYLNNGLDANFVFIPDGEDPDSFIRKYGKQEFQNYINNAQPFHHFLINTLSNQISTQSLAGKSQLVQALEPYIKKISEGAYQDLLINELAKITRIETHRLSQMLKSPNSQIKPQNNIKRSPYRIAMAILLQHPELYTNCKSELELQVLEQPKYRILYKIITEIDKNPKITSAQLIEFWRETPLFEGLIKLISWDLQIPENILENELKSILYFLNKQHKESKILLLLQKARAQGLSSQERVELQNLLKKRHQNSEIIDKNYTE